MVTFILWTACILTGLCALVFLAVGVVVTMGVVNMWRKRRALRHPLPPPDRAAERTYGQQYFERAVKKD